MMAFQLSDVKSVYCLDTFADVVTKKTERKNRDKTNVRRKAVSQMTHPKMSE